jgi:hypothetical protein
MNLFLQESPKLKGIANRLLIYAVNQVKDLLLVSSYCLQSINI